MHAGDSRSMILRALWIWQRRISARRAKLRRIALDKLSAKLPLEGDELAVHDIIHDLVMNESEMADVIEALGSYDDTFSVVIMKL